MAHLKKILIGLICISIAVSTVILLRNEGSDKKPEVAERIFESFNRDALPHIHSIEYSKDRGSLSEIIANDPPEDTHKMHPFPEMDITHVSVSNSGHGSINFKITFKEAIPASPRFEHPYRIWLKCDFDNDPSTGNTRKGSIGEDLAISINGQGEQDEWTYKIIKKSEMGKSIAATLEKITYLDRTLHFELSSDALLDEQISAFHITACAGAVKTVDTCPSKTATLPFAFSAETFNAFLQQVN